MQRSQADVLRRYCDAVFVTTTNFCAPNYGLLANADGPCNPPVHRTMSSVASMAMMKKVVLAHRHGRTLPPPLRRSPVAKPPHRLLPGACAWGWIWRCSVRKMNLAKDESIACCITKVESYGFGALSTEEIQASWVLLTSRRNQSRFGWLVGTTGSPTLHANPGARSTERARHTVELRRVDREDDGDGKRGIGDAT
jgi:hypothetical protein